MDRCGVSTRYFKRQGDFYMEGRDGQYFFQEVEGGRVIAERCTNVQANDAAEASIKYDLSLLQKHRDSYQQIVDSYNSLIALAINDLKGMGIHVEDVAPNTESKGHVPAISTFAGDEKSCEGIS